MPHTRLDHIVVTAPTLAGGVDHVSALLGVALQQGGAHPRMGTHNDLLKLGDRLYLEVIAVDPAAPAPPHPRWFGLDHVAPDAMPRLATWVARTDDIAAASAASPIALGPVEPMRRDRFHWQITIPEDGSLPCDGVAPTLIQWPDGLHPTATLADRGCALTQLECFHPDAERVSAMLAAIGFDGPVAIRPLQAGARPYLIASIATPAGPVQLGGPGGR